MVCIVSGLSHVVGLAFGTALDFVHSLPGVQGGKEYDFHGGMLIRELHGI